MTAAAASAIARPGICRVCGCTADRPCVGRSVNPETSEIEEVTCSWFDVDRTLCTNPRCIAQVPVEELEALAFGGAP